MLNEKDIQQAVDSRLSGLQASEVRRMRIRTAVSEKRREETPVRSKKTMIIAIALAAMLLTSAIAVAETLNLFDFFGRQEARFAALAPKATLEITEPALIEHPHLGSVEVKIDSAYFDGLGLSLTYQIDNSMYAEECTPTAEEIAQMKLDEPVVLAIVGNEPYVEVHEAYNEAVANGTPFGYKQYTVRVHDHTYSDDGIDLGGGMGYEDYNGTALVGLLDFEAPLADELRNRDEITVVKGVYQHECTVWFDGKECYIRYDMKDIGEIRATIPKEKDAVKAFSGKGEINGVECTFSAEVSPLAAIVTLESAAPFDTFLHSGAPEGTDAFDIWGDMALVDQAGREYRPQTGFRLQGRYEPEQMKYVDEAITSATVTFEGTGELPTGLTAYVMAGWEGAYAPELATLDGVVLTEK